MPRESGILSGTLAMLVLRVLQHEPLHGYAIAQRIHTITNNDLLIEEGSLYPALQKLMLKGWINGSWTVSDTNRKVRVYQITKAGQKQLETEIAAYRRITGAIDTVLESA
jgi:PadR family transcriptional regulator, regulatory protein PadR